MYVGFNEVPYKIFAHEMNKQNAKVIKDGMNEQCFDDKGELIGYMQHGSHYDEYYIKDSPNPLTTGFVTNIMNLNSLK